MYGIRQRIGNGDGNDTVHPARFDHQPRQPGQPIRRGHARCWHLGRQYADHAVTANLRGAGCAGFYECRPPLLIRGPLGISSLLSLLQTLEGPLQIGARRERYSLSVLLRSLGFTSGILFGCGGPGGSRQGGDVGYSSPGSRSPRRGDATGAMPLGPAGIGSGVVTAGWGNAAPIGAMSVPQAWTPGAATPRPRRCRRSVAMGGAQAPNVSRPTLACWVSLPRTGASVRAKRGIIFGNGFRPFKVMSKFRGYTG